MATAPCLSSPRNSPFRIEEERAPAVLTVLDWRGRDYEAGGFVAVGVIRPGASGNDGVAEAVSVVCPRRQIRGDQTCLLGRNATFRNRAKLSESVRQLAVGLLIAAERVSDFGQRVDRLAFTHLQIDVLPLFGHLRQIEEQQSHGKKLPLTALADESNAYRAGLLARLPDLHGYKREILSDVGRADVQVGGQSGGFAAHFRAAFGGGGKKRPARIVEKDEAFEQSRLLGFGEGAKCGSVSCGQMSGEGRMILAAGGRECIGEGGDRIVRGRRGNLSVQLGKRDR